MQNFEPSVQFFNLSLCVCITVLAGNGRCHNEGPGACKGRGSDQGPVRLWTTSYALNNPLLLWLYQHCSTHSSTFDCFFRREPRYDRMASSRMINSWLSCFYCIRHDQSHEMVLCTMCNMVVTTRLCSPPKIWKGRVLWVQNWNYGVATVSRIDKTSQPKNWKIVKISQNRSPEPTNGYSHIRRCPRRAGTFTCSFVQTQSYTQFIHTWRIYSHIIFFP